MDSETEFMWESLTVQLTNVNNQLDFLIQALMAFMPPDKAEEFEKCRQLLIAETLKETLSLRKI